MRNIGQRNDAVKIALLHHAESIDAQDGLQQRARVDIFGLTVGVENDAAFHPGVQDVVDLELAREQIDHFGKGGVVERKAGVRSGRRGRRGRSGLGRAGLRGAGGGRFGRFLLRGLRIRREGAWLKTRWRRKGGRGPLRRGWLRRSQPGYQDCDECAANPFVLAHYCFSVVLAGGLSAGCVLAPVARLASSRWMSAFSSSVNSVFLRMVREFPKGVWRSNWTLWPRSVITTEAAFPASCFEDGPGLSSHFDTPNGVVRYIQVLPWASLER